MKEGNPNATAPVIRGQTVSTEKALRGRALRKAQTQAEELLWQRLRACRTGFKFRRQQVIEGFIVDFYCHAAGLVVELDGEVHETQEDHDRRHEVVLKNRKLRILRFSNDDVINDIEGVIEQIRHECERHE